MRSLKKLVLVQTKLFMREPMALFFTLAFPGMLLLLFGAIFGNDPDPNFSPEYGFIDLETPALIAIIIASSAFMGIPIAISAMREHKVLRRFRATPLPSFTFITADLLMNYIVTLIGTLLLIIMAFMFFDLRFGGSWPLLWVAFSASALTAFSVGYLIAALSPTARIAQTVGMVLFFPNLFLSGAAFPTDLFPESLKRISDLMPMTYMVSLLQDIWLGQPWSEYGATLLILLATASAGLFLAIRLFQWE
ncbi:MAG: ABC transporter permease [Chloroflexi bacterium]|nr:ABC transporter permease [Chloroflexota bacterium]